MKDRRLGSDIKRRPLEVKLLCNSQAKVFNNILLVQIMNGLELGRDLYE